MLPLAMAFLGLLGGQEAGRARSCPRCSARRRSRARSRPGRASTSFPGMPGAPGAGRRLPGQGGWSPAFPGRQGEGVPRGSSLPHAFVRPAAAPRGLCQPAAAHAPAGGTGQGRAGRARRRRSRKRVGQQLQKH